MSVDVHQVLLQLVGLGKELHAAGAPVLGGQAQVVQGQVSLQLLLAAQLLSALLAGEFGQGGVQVQLHVRLEVGQLVERGIALIARDALRQRRRPDRAGRRGSVHGGGRRWRRRRCLTRGLALGGAALLVFLVALSEWFPASRFPRLLIQAGAVHRHHVVFKLTSRRESETALVAECGVNATGVAALVPVLVAMGEGFVLGQGLYAGELVVAEAAGVLDADAGVVPVHDVHVVVETVQVGVGGVAVVAGVNLAGLDGVNTLHVQL